MRNRQLCSEPGCYKYVDKYMIVYRNDGTPHPISLKCFSCRTERENKSLKTYEKKRRYKINKKLKNIK